MFTPEKAPRSHSRPDRRTHTSAERGRVRSVGGVSVSSAGGGCQTADAGFSASISCCYSYRELFTIGRVCVLGSKQNLPAVHVCTSEWWRRLLSF